MRTCAHNYRRKQSRVRRSSPLLAIAFAASLSTGSLAAPRLPNTVDGFRVSSSLYGNAGLLDTPNALMFDEGHYSFTVQLKQPDDRITFNFQPLPWFEGSFRYSIVRVPDGTGRGDAMDRSYDFKARLWKQRGWLPTVAVGVRDIAGTKLFAAEYIVGTWQTENFNVTGGLGWGRLSGRGQMSNPLTRIWDSAQSREDGQTDGTIGTGRYFSGENIGLFGGIEYMTPINGLKAIAEFSSDTYLAEQRRGIDIKDFPVNFGLTYKPNPYLEIGTSLIQGDTFSIRFTFQANAATMPRPKRRNSNWFLFKDRGKSFDELAPVENRVRVREIMERSLQQSADTASYDTSSETESGRDYLGPKNVWNPWGSSSSLVAGPFAQTLMSEEEKGQFARLVQKSANFQAIGVLGVGIEAHTMTVRYFTTRYSREPEAMGRLVNVLSQIAPDHIEEFKLVPVAHQLDALQATFNRSELERVNKSGGTAAELYTHADLQGVSPPLDHGSLYPQDGFKPTFGYGISPIAEFSLFDPDDPARYQIALNFHGDIDLTNSIHLAGTYSLNVYNNYDEITRGPSSNLQHVRTETANYLREGENGFEFLTATHSWNPAKDVFTRIYGGLFESMYGGVGAEVLYRPYHSRWATALEIDWVRQRDYNLMFDFQDYETVTGFAKIYYQVPYHDLDLEVNIGRYLAKDIGATFKLTKVFDNGTEIGIYATFTDVPFKDFGEGSFDKGLIFRIPFHLYSSKDTKRRYNTVIKMITRDGGAQVESGATLYQLTSWHAKRWMTRHWNSLLE